MEACAVVEKEVDKVLNKFSDANVNADSSLDDVLQYISGIREELFECKYIELLPPAYVVCGKVMFSAWVFIDRSLWHLTVQSPKQQMG